VRESLYKILAWFYHLFLRSKHLRVLWRKLFGRGVTIREVDANRDLLQLVNFGEMELNKLNKQAYRQRLISLKRELKNISSGKEIFLVAEKKGKIIGFARICFYTSAIWWLRGIGVESFFRAQGIGEALLKTGINKVRNLKGAKRICLKVKRNNKPARVLYQKFLFQKCQLSSHCSCGERKESEYIMLTKSLG
jgi:GNAT superfamily N-acetyltransferase